MTSVSYGYGTCRGCGRVAGAKKDGTAWAHDVMTIKYGRHGRWLCEGCHQPMIDIQPTRAAALDASREGTK